MNLDFLRDYIPGYNTNRNLNTSLSGASPGASSYFNMDNFGDFGNYSTQSAVSNTPLVSGNSPTSYLNFDTGSGINSALTAGIDTTPSSHVGSFNFNSDTNPMNSWFSQNKDMLNFGTAAATGLASLYGAYNTSKANSAQLALARDQYNTNLNNYRQLTNADMSDRQDRRVAANPNAESRESYMKKWGV